LWENIYKTRALTEPLVGGAGGAWHADNVTYINTTYVYTYIHIYNAYVSMQTTVPESCERTGSSMWRPHCRYIYIIIYIPYIYIYKLQMLALIQETELLADLGIGTSYIHVYIYIYLYIFEC